MAKFDILLYNAWNTELKNVYAEMQITDTDNNVYTDFRTVAINLASKELGRLEGYWYTKDVMPGIYHARIILNYANRVQSQEFELEVYTNKIVARPMHIGQAISAPEELNLEKNAFLILIILGMGIVIAVLVFKLRKRKKDKVAKDDEKIQTKTIIPISTKTQIKETNISEGELAQDNNSEQEAVDEGGNKDD